MLVVRSLILGSVVICLVGLGVEAASGKKAAELLIGKWKLEKKEKVGDKDVSFSLTAEFTKDGKMKVMVKVGEPINFNETSEGMYKLIDDKTLSTEMPKGPKKDLEKETMKIKTLTETKLVLIGGEKGKGKTEELEFDRVK